MVQTAMCSQCGAPVGGDTRSPAVRPCVGKRLAVVRVRVFFMVVLSSLSARDAHRARLPRTTRSRCRSNQARAARAVVSASRSQNGARPTGA